MDKDVKVFLEGLAEYGVVFTQLLPGTKRTKRTWDQYEDMHDQRGESRVDLADQWLNQGFGVGYLLRGGLAVVDADGPATVQRVKDFEESNGYIHFPKVSTPSGGIHALLVHPQGIDHNRLKNHVCHPKENGVKVPWDFKLGERTMLVAPGTVMPKGTYKPGPWLTPPTVDVRFIAPELDIYKTTPEFVRDTRVKKYRIIAAMTYLAGNAPVSVKGKQSRSTLMTVAAHVVGYYDLDPSLAFHLMTQSKGGHVSWNERCLGDDGKPRPWDHDDLMDALVQAVDIAPGYGISLHERQQEREYARWSVASFLDALTYLPTPSAKIWMSADSLYNAFLEFAGIKEEFYDKKELGCDLANAMDAGRLPFITRDRNNVAGRIYRGLDVNTLQIALARYQVDPGSFAASA